MTHKLIIIIFNYKYIFTDKRIQEEHFVCARVKGYITLYIYDACYFYYKYLLL